MFAESFIFGMPDFDGHEQVVFAADPATGLRAIIAIHDTTRGPALGGCRLWTYAGEAEAVHDVLRLSRGMTFKAALADLPFGGGKSVIMADPGRAAAFKTPELMRAMGRAVERLGGRYIVAEDVGTTTADMVEIRRETRHVAGLPAETNHVAGLPAETNHVAGLPAETNHVAGLPAETNHVAGLPAGMHRGSGDPSPATAFGVWRGMIAAAAHRLRRTTLDGLAVAVQGLGNVGWHLCRHLHQDGVRLYVADVRPQAVQRAIEMFGAIPVAPEAIHRVQADIFAPCALGAVINDVTLPGLRVAIVAGSANNQLAEPRHGAELAARGILYAPDYAINAGGLINISHEQAPGGYDRQRAFAHVARIQDTLMEIFHRAERDGVPPDVAADRLALARLGRPARRAA